MRSVALLSLLLSPTLALAEGPPEAYLEGLWRAKKDTATAGAVVAGLGIAVAGAGFALDGQPDMPAELLLVSGALGTAGGVTVMSIGLMLKEGEALVWRGPMLMGALQQLLQQVNWGELERTRLRELERPGAS